MPPPFLQARQSAAFFFVKAGSGPRPRTKRFKIDCTLSPDYYNISYIIIYYTIIKLLVMENHLSQNRKRN